MSAKPTKQRAAENGSSVQTTGPPPTTTTTTTREPRQMSKIERQEEILSRCRTPPHWRAPTGRLQRNIFNMLCITSFGHAGLHPIWAAIRLEGEGDDSIWADAIDQTCNRLNNMLLVASLLLATAAAFITTTPPRASIVNYTLRGPYICMLSSFGLLLGGILVTSVCVLVAGKARPYWCEQVLFATRFHVYSTLILLSYPFFSIGAAAILLAFGILSSIWCATDTGVQGAAVVFLLLPIGMASLFGVSCSTAVAQSRLRKDSVDS